MVSGAENRQRCAAGLKKLTLLVEELATWDPVLGEPVEDLRRRAGRLGGLLARLIEGLNPESALVVARGAPPVVELHADARAWWRGGRWLLDWPERRAVGDLVVFERVLTGRTVDTNDLDLWRRTRVPVELGGTASDGPLVVLRYKDD